MWPKDSEFSGFMQELVNTRKMKTFSFKSKVVIYPGVGGWHFVGTGKTIATELRSMKHLKKIGFGFIPVKATIGKTSWDTTLFPDSKTGSYLLAIKAAIRKKEDIANNDVINVEIVIK